MGPSPVFGGSMLLIVLVFSVFFLFILYLSGVPNVAKHFLLLSIYNFLFVSALSIADCTFGFL